MPLDLNTIDTSNPEALMSAFEQLETGEAPEPAPAPPAAEPAPAPAADAEVKGNEPPAGAEVKKDEQSQLDEPEPDGVATKDGKHIIPYNVLRSERERANRAEQLLRDAQAQLEALRTPPAAAGSEGAKPGESARTEATPDVTDLSAEEMAALKEDFPTIYKAITTTMAAAKAVEDKLKPVEQAHEDQKQAAQRTAQETVQDAIDATPKLAHIQASAPALFEMAKQFDAALRATPAWANKPLSERFAKVTEMVEQANGPIDLPGSKAPSQQQTPEQLRAAAEATARASARATHSAVPTSLSEFPAGSPPASDERQAVEQMSQHQLAEKFAAMTPEQMDAYLEKL